MNIRCNFPIFSAWPSPGSAKARLDRKSHWSCLQWSGGQSCFPGLGGQWKTGGFFRQYRHVIPRIASFWCVIWCVIYDTIVPFSQLMWHTPIIALYCLFRTSLSQPCWGATQRHYKNIGHANLYLWLSAYVYCGVRLQYPLDSFVCLTRVCVCVNVRECVRAFAGI